MTGRLSDQDEPMGFIEAARLIIEALRDGRFQHEPRPFASGKNLLANGDVSPDEVIRLIRRCRADRHEFSVHHADPSQEIHIFKPIEGGVRWYIKAYLIELDDVTAVFISVHESDH